MHVHNTSKIKSVKVFYIDDIAKSSLNEIPNKCIDNNFDRYFGLNVVPRGS